MSEIVVQVEPAVIVETEVLVEPAVVAETTVIVEPAVVAETTVIVEPAVVAETTVVVEPPVVNEIVVQITEGGGIPAPAVVELYDGEVGVDAPATYLRFVRDEDGDVQQIILGTAS